MRPTPRSPGASTGFIFRRWIAPTTLSMRRSPGSKEKGRESISARSTTWRRCSSVSPQRASSCPTLASPPIAASAARRPATCRRFCRITWTRRKSPEREALSLGRSVAISLPLKGGGQGGVRGREACASAAAVDPHLLASLAASPFQGEDKESLHDLLAGYRFEVLVKNLVVGRLVHAELVENAQRLAHIHGAAFRIERAVGSEHDLVDGEELHAALGRRLRGERGSVGPEIVLEIIERPLLQAFAQADVIVIRGALAHHVVARAEPA